MLGLENSKAMTAVNFCFSGESPLITGVETLFVLDRCSLTLLAGFSAIRVEPAIS